MQCQEVDLYVDKNKPTIQDYIKILTPAHSEGRILLMSNDQALLSQKRKKICTDMSKNNISKMSLKQLRYYAKRLGIENSKQKSKKDLCCSLQKITQDMQSSEKKIVKEKEN